MNSAGKDGAPSVPGANARTVNATSLWNSLARWVLKSRSPFSTFWHSYLHNDQTDAFGTASDLWPMPAPYNGWFWKNEGQPRKCARQKAVNLVVLMLSWLHMKRPSRCPPGLSPHTRLSRKQWGILRRFEAQLKGVELVGMVGPAEMGRTAAKMEGLDSILHDLFARACSW